MSTHDLSWHIFFCINIVKLERMYPLFISCFTSVVPLIHYLTSHELWLFHRLWVYISLKWYSSFSGFISVQENIYTYLWIYLHWLLCENNKQNVLQKICILCLPLCVLCVYVVCAVCMCDWIIISLLLGTWQTRVIWRWTFSRIRSFSDSHRRRGVGLNNIRT